MKSKRSFPKNPTKIPVTFQLYGEYWTVHRSAEIYSTANRGSVVYNLFKIRVLPAIDSLICEEACEETFIHELCHAIINLIAPAHDDHDVINILEPSLYQALNTYDPDCRCFQLMGKNVYHTSECDFVGIITVINKTMKLPLSDIQCERFGNLLHQYFLTRV